MKKMKIISLICAGIVSVGALLNTAAVVSAATTTITIENDNYEIKNGDEITVKIYLSSDTNIGAYHAEVIYDDYRLQYVDGGDNENDGRIILEGTGYGETIVYKLVFKAISGGKAEISCAGADIRVKGTGTEKQEVLYSGSVKLDILGDDTAIREKNLEKYGVDLNIPLAGIVDTADGNRYYIVDHFRYIPGIVDFEYRTVKDTYEKASYTFITNADNDVRLLYLVDSKGVYVMYAYSKSKKALYPCEIVESDGTKYYVMSPNACDKWADELTLDYVKKENICYAMKSDGVCAFYKYDEGNLTVWTEDEGQAFLDGQMELFYGILVGTVTVTIIIIIAIVISGHRKQSKKHQKRENQEELGDGNQGSDYGIEFIDIDEESAVKREERWKTKEKPVIAVKDVTMRFRISTSNASGIKELIIQKLKRQVTHRDFKALDHVSLNIYKGEVVGIIGTNGSGKSTLLKLVSGALTPSEGKIKVDKKKVQLLSLGTGFDRELTARENIYLSGAIIGYTKEFVDRNFDKIIEFAELEDFVDEKVKNFSSGMVSRLGFAIATIGDAAEILILDEVLSVGDEFFRKKSLKRVKEMLHGGSTVIMVAHGIGTILENCTKVVWLEKGKVKMVGDPRAVCKAYRKFNN